MNVFYSLAEPLFRVRSSTKISVESAPTLLCPFHRPIAVPLSPSSPLLALVCRVQLWLYLLLFSVLFFRVPFSFPDYTLIHTYITPPALSASSSASRALACCSPVPAPAPPQACASSLSDTDKHRHTHIYREGVAAAPAACRFPGPVSASVLFSPAASCARFPPSRPCFLVLALSVPTLPCPFAPARPLRFLSLTQHSPLPCLLLSTLPFVFSGPAPCSPVSPIAHCRCGPRCCRPFPFAPLHSRPPPFPASRFRRFPSLRLFPSLPPPSPPFPTSRSLSYFLFLLFCSPLRFPLPSHRCARSLAALLLCSPLLPFSALLFPLWPSPPRILFLSARCLLGPPPVPTFPLSQRFGLAFSSRALKNQILSPSRQRG